VNRAAGTHQDRNVIGAEKPSSGFRPGSRVRHPKFGNGIVLAREGDGADAKLTVEFSRVGVKKLVEKYAALEPLPS